jgi:hypothetical protein
LVVTAPPVVTAAEPPNAVVAPPTPTIEDFPPTPTMLLPPPTPTPPALHTPATQLLPVGHTTLHWPQFVASFWKFTQPAPHCVKGALQLAAQKPALQNGAAGPHTMPQLPQLAASVWRLAQ